MKAAQEKVGNMAKQEVTAHIPLRRGAVHFCNGGLPLVRFAMPR